MIQEDLYVPKLQDAVQLQTVLALYDQEIARYNGQTYYLRLKTAVKLHIDQIMRNRNFRVRKDDVERGSVTKSQKGKKAYVERKAERVFSEEGQMDTVPKETHEVSVMTLQPLETVAKVRDEKDDRLLLHASRRQSRPTAITFTGIR